MRALNFLVPALIALAGSLPAQNQILRGQIGYGPDGDYLVGTDWPVKFAAKVVPDYWYHNPVRMVVDNIGPADDPVVVVYDAKPERPLLNLGEFVVGGKAVCQIDADVGNFVVVLFDAPENMTWSTPFGNDIARDVWLLGSAPFGMLMGLVTAPDGFNQAIYLPKDPSFVGDSYVVQALIFDAGGFSSVRMTNYEVRTLK